MAEKSQDRIVSFSWQLCHVNGKLTVNYVCIICFTRCILYCYVYVVACMKCTEDTEKPSKCHFRKKLKIQFLARIMELYRLSKFNLSEWCQCQNSLLSCTRLQLKPLLDIRIEQCCDETTGHQCRNIGNILQQNHLIVKMITLPPAEYLQDTSDDGAWTMFRCINLCIMMVGLYDIFFISASFKNWPLWEQVLFCASADNDLKNWDIEIAVFFFATM